MGMLKRTIKYKEAWIMVTLYKTLVRPLCQCVETVLQEKQGARGKGLTYKFTKMIVNM